MIISNSHPGFKWNRTKAINCWLVCLPAFQTEHPPLKILQWFVSAADKSYTTTAELCGVVLELIQRYEVFEMFPTTSDLIEMYITYLGTVMPMVTSGGRFGLLVDWESLVSVTKS